MTLRPALVIVLVALACHGSDPARAARQGVDLPACEAYLDRAEPFAYCVFTEAGRFDDVATCAAAGRWERDCRHAWVADRLTDEGVSVDRLLAACDDSDDCALEVLDRRPVADLDEQLALCGSRAGRFGADCAGHAMQRWFQARPSAEAIAERLAAPTAFPDKVGWFVGASLACQGLPECAPGPDPDRHDTSFFCRKGFAYSAEHLNEPEWCQTGRSTPAPGQR